MDKENEQTICSISLDQSPHLQPFGPTLADRHQEMQTNGTERNGAPAASREPWWLGAPALPPSASAPAPRPSCEFAVNWDVHFTAWAKTWRAWERDRKNGWFSRVFWEFDSLTLLYVFRFSGTYLATGGGGWRNLVSLIGGSTCFVRPRALPKTLISSPLPLTGALTDSLRMETARSKLLRREPPVTQAV